MANLKSFYVFVGLPTTVFVKAENKNDAISKARKKILENFANRDWLERNIKSAPCDAQEIGNFKRTKLINRKSCYWQ